MSQVTLDNRTPPVNASRHCIETIVRESRRSNLEPRLQISEIRAKLASSQRCAESAVMTDDVIEQIARAARLPAEQQLDEEAAIWGVLPAKKKSAKATVSNPVAAPGLPKLDAKLSDDFIADYLEYADYLEIPREAHRLAALMLVMAAANSNDVVIKNGSLSVSLDLWAVLLKPSGAGGNSLLRAFHEIEDSAGLKLSTGVEFGSTSQAQEHFSKKQRDVLVLEEMSATIEEWRSQRHYAGLVPWLTNLYDNFRPPKGKQYRTASDDEEENEKKKTPDIQFPHAPRTCILGISAESWFFKAAQSSDFKGGWWPRHVLVRVEDNGTLIPSPRQVEGHETLRLSLAAKLQQIASIKGEMHLSPEAQKRYNEWYVAKGKHFRTFANQPVAQPIWHRHRDHCLKFAAGHQLSTKPQLIIELPALEKAIKDCDRLEETIIRLVGVQLTHLGEERDEVLQMIEKGEAEGVLGRDVRRSIRGKRHQDKAEILESLIAEERIFLFRVGNSAVFVAEKYLAAFKKAQGSQAKKLKFRDWLLDT